MTKLFSTILTISLCSTLLSSEKPSNQKKEPEKRMYSHKTIHQETKKMMSTTIIDHLNTDFLTQIGSALSPAELAVISHKKSKL